MADLFGTTQEEYQGIQTGNTVLWSAESLVEQNEESLVGAHLLFLRAGAEIISTTTYQCSLSTFQSIGIEPRRALSFMRRAVELAAEARRKHFDQRMCFHPNVRIALSLGPFGDTLNPTQEFNGFYPPYYDRKVKGLANFPFDRLQTFASDDTWSSTHCIAMETVPLVREVIAIREAFSRLHEYLGVSGKPLKPWWISFVFLDAIPVQQNARIFDYVQSAVVSIQSVFDNILLLPVPSGLGINCVDVDRIGTAALEM